MWTTRSHDPQRERERERHRHTYNACVSALSLTTPLPCSGKEARTGEWKRKRGICACKKVCHYRARTTIQTACERGAATADAVRNYSNFLNDKNHEKAQRWHFFLFKYVNFFVSIQAILITIERWLYVLPPPSSSLVTPKREEECTAMFGHAAQCPLYTAHKAASCKIGSKQ